MFGLEFLFTGALLAIPLAGLPVLLHLLFRRKSPVVEFSTTRFVRATLQHTAARRRVQKWLLLTARVLLMLLLILAAAQPARKMVGSTDASGVAAIVVDTTYSMLLKPDDQSLLAKADQLLTDLLQNELAGANVAVFTSRPDRNREKLVAATELLARHSPFTPEPGTQPLADRIAVATLMLERQQAANKWLVIITDGQSRELPRPIDASPGGRVLVFDLHPQTPRSAGVSQLRIDPDQPIPGVLTDAVIRLTGRAGESRAVVVETESIDGTPRSSASPRVVQISPSGQAELRVPIKIPSDPFSVVRARLEGDDDLTWDDARQIVVQTPGQRQTRLIAGSSSPTQRFVKLALDPSEGRLKDWPLMVKQSGAIENSDRAIVECFNAWPSAQHASELRQAAERGASLVLMWRPGLQETWKALPEPQRTAILPLLPGEPLADLAADRPRRARVPISPVPDLRDLMDARFQFDALAVDRLMPFDRRADAISLLDAGEDRPAEPRGLIYRHRVGAGSVCTFATLPDPQFTSLATHPIFLPMLIRACLPSASASMALNVEMGEPVRLASPSRADATLQTAAGDKLRVERQPKSNELVYAATDAPGIYRWLARDDTVIAAASAQYPAEESVLVYRQLPELIEGEDVIFASDIAGFRAQYAESARPQPRWSPLIAAMLLLLCFEAIVGNSARIWKLVAERPSRAYDPARTLTSGT